MPLEERGFPTDTLGIMRGWAAVVNVAQPAPGADWKYTLPGGYFYRLAGGSGILTTSVTVANRLILLEYTDGANVVMRTGGGTAMTASLTVNFGLSAVGGSTNANATVATNIITCPAKWLQPGYVIQTHTFGIQAADQWSSVVLWLEQLALGDLHAQYSRGAPTVPTNQL